MDWASTYGSGGLKKTGVPENSLISPLKWRKMMVQGLWVDVEQVFI
jgi:hypothetical protein